MKAKLTVEVISQSDTFSNVQYSGVPLSVYNKDLEILYAEEPTEPGLYKIRFADGTVSATWLGAGTRRYYRIGETETHTWQELGNIIECEPVI